jgi:hypothetical protein
MQCTSTVCKLEASQRDIRSRGIVRDNEKLCRAGFDPDHYRKNGAVKQSLIPNKQLASGEVSVWRVSDTKDSTELAGVAKKLKPPSNNFVRELLIASAAAIRELKHEHYAEHRFCVLDECVTDDVGGFDPAHAHVTFCREVDLKAAGPDTVEFQDLRTQLLFAFTSGERWTPT